MPEQHAFKVRRYSIFVTCAVLLLGVWAIDIVSPQLFVVAILLSVPIALSSATLSRRFTIWLTAVALVADATAGWYNAFQDHFGLNPIAIGDRLLVALSIVLVAALTLRGQTQAVAAGKLSERHKRSEVLRDLIYALSHDLRTPLTAARMTMIQALQGAYGDFSPCYHDILVRSIESNEELYRLAETLLLVARYESGEQSTLREPVNLSHVVHAISDELEPLILSKNLDLQIHSPDPAPYVMADRSELRRAITNLVANAVAWTPVSGHIALTVLAEERRAILSIEDDGYGVPDAVRKSLFQRFSGRARQGGGSGLGLYIVRRIAEGHGGFITYRPGNRSGSVFNLTLPRLPELTSRG